MRARRFGVGRSRRSHGRGREYAIHEFQQSSSEVGRPRPTSLDLARPRSTSLDLARPHRAKLGETASGPTGLNRRPAAERMAVTSGLARSARGARAGVLRRAA
eukprot:658811-Prymnesium_polylepis.1